MLKKMVWILGWVVLLSGWAWAQLAPSQTPKSKQTGFRLHSSSFRDGGLIPDLYTCKGRNISPELNWKNAPSKTKTFAIIVDDPDAPTQIWVHWVIYNIPEKATLTDKVYELLENYPRDEKTTDQILQGVNDFRKIGYDGPCPPSGLHRYYFKLYALDTALALPAGATKDKLLNAMKGHILAWTQIMGLYGN
jgi:Raf kinase inhibitor-like YbhB/YbcL family protein